jgi:hypothetical protein
MRHLANALRFGEVAFRNEPDRGRPSRRRGTAEQGITEEADTGMVMLIPGVHGEAEIARFKLAGGLINPLHN